MPLPLAITHNQLSVQSTPASNCSQCTANHEIALSCGCGRNIICESVDKFRKVRSWFLLWDLIFPWTCGDTLAVVLCDLCNIAANMQHIYHDSRSSVSEIVPSHVLHCGWLCDTLCSNSNGRIAHFVASKMHQEVLLRRNEDTILFLRAQVGDYAMTFVPAYPSDRRYGWILDGAVH